MGYNKVVQYGDVVEVYEYQRDIKKRNSFKRGYARPVRYKHNRVSGDVSVQQKQVDVSAEEVGRRRSNARRSRMVFNRLTVANSQGDELVALITFTFKTEVSLLEGYASFTRFSASLRRQLGKDYRYLCTAEFTKRGRLHFHAIYWGLPQEIIDNERETRFIAGIWQEGFVDCKRTDGNPKAGFYLGKYIMKSALNFSVKFKKLYFCSRNCIRPISLSVDNLDFVYSDVIGVEKSLASDKEYMTKWLGKGRCRIYKSNI